MHTHTHIHTTHTHTHTLTLTLTHSHTHTHTHSHSHTHTHPYLYMSRLRRYAFGVLTEQLSSPPSHTPSRHPTHDLLVMGKSPQYFQDSLGRRTTLEVCIIILLVYLKISPLNFYTRERERVKLFSLALSRSSQRSDLVKLLRIVRSPTMDSLLKRSALEQLAILLNGLYSIIICTTE